jgi:hypothetical protein
MIGSASDSNELQALVMSEAPPALGSPDSEIPADLLAAAAQRRAQQDVDASAEIQSMQEYELRQAFRRLIDPGILRPNSKDVATTSLKVFGHALKFLCLELIKPFYSRLC